MGPQGPICSRHKAPSARMFIIHPNAAGKTPDRISLWRIQPLTSVAYGATAGPQKEGALVCSKGANLGPARGSYAGRLAFPRKEANEPRLRRQWNPDDSTPKRENDTARGPFLGKGLPPGWG